jgi:CRP-like cAMP-binding protein
MNTADLSGIRILADMTLAQRAALAEYGEVIEVPGGRRLLEQGSQSKALYFVLSGKLGVYYTEAGKGEIVMRTLSVGDHFGEIALLGAGKRTANVRAIERSNLFRIDPGSFNGIMNVPELAIPLLLGISRSLASRLDEATKRIAALWLAPWTV